MFRFPIPAPLNVGQPPVFAHMSAGNGISETANAVSRRSGYRRERAGAFAETRQSSDKSPHLPSQRDQGLAGESLKACGPLTNGGGK